MTRIVLLDRGTMRPGMELTRPAFPHEWIEHAATPLEEIGERLAGARIAVTNKAPIRRGDLERLPDLRMIAVAGFDCVTTEPMPPDHCLNPILGRPNVIVTPHVAWASEEAMRALWAQVVGHIENFNAGRPSNVVV